jgi:hypothetical protein
MANKSQEEIYNAAANRAVTRSLRTGQNGGTPVTSEKKIADGILEFFSSTGPLQTALGGIQSSVQQFGGVVNGTSTGSMDTRTYRALKYQYANMYVKAALGEAATNIDRAGDNALATIDRASESLVKTFQPVSSFVGSTLYTLTGMMKDPIGSIGALPNTVSSIMDKMNPGFSQTITSTWQKNNIQKLAEMPGQLFGNIQQMVKTIDGVLAVPIGLINDAYRGFMELVGKISDFVNKIFDGLSRAVDNIIDGLFPGLTDFLAQAAAFTNQIGQISSAFAGVNQITQFTNQLTTGINQINSIIQNPLDLAFAYAPPQLSQGLYALQNPQAIINQFLPPELSQAFAGISKITGFGFNGNMGFGLESVLEGFQGGVLASILQGYATQFSILSPIFTGQSVTPQYFANETGTVETPDGTTYTTPNNSRVVVGRTPQPNYGQPTIQNPVAFIRDTTTPASETGRGRFNARTSEATRAQATAADIQMRAAVESGRARGTTTGTASPRRVDV